MLTSEHMAWTVTLPFSWHWLGFQLHLKLNQHCQGCLERRWCGLSTHPTPPGLPTPFCLPSPPLQFSVLFPAASASLTISVDSTGSRSPGSASCGPSPFLKDSTLLDVATQAKRATSFFALRTYPQPVGKSNGGSFVGSHVFSLVALRRFPGLGALRSPLYWPSYGSTCHSSCFESVFLKSENLCFSLIVQNS